MADFENYKNGYRPGGHVGNWRKGQSIRASSTTKSDATEIRDLNKTISGLKRELERKSSRVDNLVTEIQNIRGIATTQEREVRILRGMYEKINEEKSSLNKEMSRMKLREKKLETQLARMGEAHAILVANQDLRNSNDKLKRDLKDNKVALDIKNEEVENLKREFEIMQRAFDIESKYESNNNNNNKTNNGLLDVGNNRETMRTLYYELGKRQTDAHGMALTIAQTRAELVDTQKNLETKDTIVIQLKEELESCKTHCDQLLKQTLTDADEIASVNSELLNARDSVSQLQSQVEELSRRLAQTRVATDERETELTAIIAEQKIAADASSRELKSLRTQIEAMQLSLSHSESVQRISDRRSEEERRSLIALREEVAREKEALEREKGAHGVVSADLLTLREDLSKREEEIARARSELAANRSEMISSEEYHNRINESEAQIDTLRSEKDEGMVALQRAMSLVRDLSSKLSKETTAARTAQEKINELQRNKEQFSVAVLDALDKEKRKTATLERSLSILQSQLRGMPSPQASSSIPSTVFPSVSLTNTAPTLGTGLGTGAEGSFEDSALTPLQTGDITGSTDINSIQSELEELERMAASNQ